MSVPICFWCGKVYYGEDLYHVCEDGTNYKQRWDKTSEEIIAEHARQERLRAGYNKSEISWNWSLAKHDDRPPARKRDIIPAFAWVPSDDELLRGMKILWDDWDTH